MKLFKLLEGLYTELKTYNERETKREEEERRGTQLFSKPTPTAYSVPPEYRWIKLQLFQRNIRHKDIARKANCTTQFVSQVICGQRNSENVRAILAQMLGYATYQDLMEAASRGQEGGAA
jgi:hypothetical protein